VIAINNWDKWQSYRKDRGTPPWIKIHRNLMTNPEWAILSDSEKGQLVSLWIVAADKNGTLPTSDTQVLQKIAALDTPPNINKFTQLGFMTTTCQPDDNQMTTTCQPDDAPETEKRQRRKEKTNVHFDIFWNEYPKKKDKANALKVWKSKKLSNGKFDKIMDGLRKVNKSDDWVKENGRYVPGPAKWLRGSLWNDEISSIQSSQEPGGIK